MSDLRSIFIPLAAAHGPGRIAHIIADTATDASGASGFDPAIAALADVELQDAGQVALDAVRLNARPMRPRRRLTKPVLPTVGLSCANRSNVAGLTAANSASAELGLAIGLMSVLHGSRRKAFFATGALSGKDTNVSPAFGKVVPVEDIDQKLEVCAEWLEAHIGHPWGREIQLFTPMTDTKGDAFETTYADALGALRDRAGAVGVEITHRPVGDLFGALSFLDPEPAASDAREVTARVALGGMVAAFLGAAALWGWVASPPEMSFLNAGSGTTSQAINPIAMAVNPTTGELSQRPACLDSRLRPRLSVSEAMTLRATTATPAFGPDGFYHALLVVAGEASGARVFSPEVDDDIVVRNADGQLILTSTHFLAPPGEVMRATIAMRKLLAFDIEDIQTRLIQIELETEPGQARLDAVTAYLSSFRWTTQIATEFQVVETPDACIGRTQTVCAWRISGSANGRVKNYQPVSVPPDGELSLTYEGDAAHTRTLVLRDDAYFDFVSERTVLQDNDRLVLIESQFDEEDDVVAEYVINPFGHIRGTGPSLATKLGDFRICTIPISN